MSGSGGERAGFDPTGLIVQYATQLALLVGLTFVLFRDRLLPPRFFYDGDHIQQLALHRAYAYGDLSYVNVAETYRALGLADQGLVAGLAGYALLVAATLLALKDRSASGFWPLLVIPFALVIGAVYLGFYSKDVLVLPITLLVLTIRRRIAGDIAVLVAVLLYATFFRTYWYIVAVLFLLYRIVLRLTTSERLLLLVVGMAVVSVAVALHLALGVSPDHFRLDVNARRAGDTDADSMIRPFVELPDPLGGIVNVALTFLALLVPLPLASLGGAYYLGVSLLLVSAWTGVAVAVRRTLRAGVTLSDPRYARALALVLALLTTQALFEPDYGSALRHLSPLLPLLVYLVCAAPEAGGPPGLTARSMAGSARPPTLRAR